MRHHVVHRAGVFLAGLGLVALAASLRCVNVDRGLGEACERNEDCLSGVCAGQICVPQPPVRTSFPSTDAAVPVDASGDGGDAVASSTTTASSASTSSGAGGSDGSADGASPDGGTLHDGGPDGTATKDASKDGPASKDGAPVKDGMAPAETGSPRDTGVPRDAHAG